MFTLRLRIATGLGLTLVSALLTLGLALSLPTTGVTFQAADDVLEANVEGAFRQVARFEAGEQRFAGAARLAMEEPDLLPTWPAYDGLLAELGALAGHAESGRLELVLADGMRQPLETRARSVGDLPAEFWLQTGCGVLALMLSVLVWSPRPRELPAVLFALTGVGYMISIQAAAVYSTRELFIATDLFRTLSVTNHAGALLFTAALTSLLWCYPLRLGGPRLVAGTFAAAAFAVGLDVTRALATVQYNVQLWVVLIFAVGIVGSAVQWRATRADAEARAVLRWFLLSIYAGTLIFTAVFLLPAILGAEVLVPQAVLFATFLPMYVGMALGVLRYRLFDLERWWFFIWAWALGGVAVILVDLTLLTVLTTAETTSLAIAAAVVGWLYFPVRQWAWRKWVARERDDLEAWLDDALPPMLTVRQEGELLPALRRTLTTVFEPLSSTVVVTTSDLVELRDNGQALLVPLHGTRRGIRLEHGFGGARLFTRLDLQTAQRVLALYAVVVRALRAQEAGATAERERIRKDIHDDLGAKLLTLLHRAGPSERPLVREAIRDLRELLGALEASPVPLAAALDQWRGECEARCRDAGVKLSWREQDRARNFDLAPRTHHQVTRVLREALSNALRHADPLQVRVEARPGLDTLELRVENDGRVPRTEAFVPGRGAAIMRQRAESLGGSLAWTRRDEFWSVHLAVPLATGDETALPHAPAAPDAATEAQLGILPAT